MFACSICCGSCSARNLAGARRSLIRTSCISRLRISSRRLPLPRPTTTSETRSGRVQRAEKRRLNRGALPAHLPRVHVTIEPDDTNCPCCRAPMHVIGEETLATARRDPGAVPGARDAPPQICLPGLRAGSGAGAGAGALIKGGLPTEAMVASVLVAKYAWHLPLYRQAQMLAAQGIDIKRAVLAFWVGYAAAELKPLHSRLRELILASAKIAVDETVAPVLDPGRGRTKKGYFWADRARRPALGREPTRRPSPTATLPGAVRSTGSSCSRAIAASCSATAMPPTRRLPTQHPARPSRSPSVGPICGAGSSTSPRAAMRRSRAKRLSASPRSMRSRRRSAGRAPRNAAPCARTRASRSWRRSELGSSSNSRASPPRRRSPRRSATA